MLHFVFQAEDKDSGKFGAIAFELVEGTGSNLLGIDNTTGVVQTTKLLDSVPDEDLPIQVTVRAKDNPSSSKGNTNTSRIVVGSVFTIDIL